MWEEGGGFWLLWRILYSKSNSLAHPGYHGSTHRSWRQSDVGQMNPHQTAPILFYTYATMHNIKLIPLIQYSLIWYCLLQLLPTTTIYFSPDVRELLIISLSMSASMSNTCLYTKLKCNQLCISLYVSILKEIEALHCVNFVCLRSLS